MARSQGEKGVILAKAHIRTGMPLGAALACNNVASEHFLAAEYLDAEPLAV